MVASATDRRTHRTADSAVRRRGFRLFAVVGAVAWVTLMSQPAAATQPEPPDEPAPPESSTTAPAPPETTSVPTSTVAPSSEGSTTTEAKSTTTEVPATTVLPSPIAPSVVYSANAECDPETGQTTVSWQLVNNGETPVEIITTSADVSLEPNPVPADGSASATMTLDGPDTDQQVATTVTIDDGSGADRAQRRHHRSRM